jgi:Domain of unknown function (DUF6458)
VGQHHGMGIGLGIFLIALGAILTFAVDWTVAGLDLRMVGRVLMVAGAVGLILFFVFWSHRRAPQAVAVLPQPRVDPAPRTYDDATPPPPTTVSPVEPLPPAPLKPALVPPAQVTAVSATAPVKATS